MDEQLIASAEARLAERDPQLGRLIASQKIEVRPLRTDYFASLCRSIVGQQVSVAAAAAINARLASQTELLPERIASLTEDDIKIIGLSKQKAGYLRDLAGHFVGNPNIYNHLENQADSQVIAELTAIKGVGVWTAQMFLMFTLARPDVFAPLDVGLQKGMMKLYGWEKLPPPRELEAFAERWKPYRTIASFHLWRSLETV